MGCLIYYHMKSWNKQQNTPSESWNWLIWIFCSSMEFHGIPWNSSEVLWNSIHRRSQVRFHGIPWECYSSMDLDANNEFQGISWNSMESFHPEKNSVKKNSVKCQTFHGTCLYHQIPWNSQLRSSMEFHGTVEVPWILDSHQISRNSMEYCMELWGSQIRYHRVPRLSTELCEHHFHLLTSGSIWLSWNIQLEFNGTLELSNKMSTNYMEFHGTWLLLIQTTSCFPGLPWNFL